MMPSTTQCCKARSGNKRQRPQATIKVKNADPIVPSQVFLGEIFGKSGVLPLDAKVKVSIGQTVKGNVDVLAEL